MPSDEEFKSRVEHREKEEGKEIPESAVLEMKGRKILERASECVCVCY